MSVVEKLARQMGVTQSVVEEFLLRLAEAAEEEILAHGEVNVPQLGRFERLLLPGGVRYDPETRLPTMLPRIQIVAFEPHFKYRINESKESAKKSNVVELF